MSGSTNVWSIPTPESDLASHLTQLSVDEYSTPARPTAGANPPTFANGHTPPRPSFPPYDNAQFLHYYAMTAGGNIMEPTAFSPQHYPYELATPLQSPGAGMPYDPYPSPGETYSSGGHSDGRQATGSAHYQQQSQPQPQAQNGLSLGGVRNGNSSQPYRPPHMVQQLRELQDITAQQQQQYFAAAYVQRSPYYNTPHATPERQVGGMAGAATMTPTNSRQRNNRMGSGGPRRQNSGQHSQLTGFPDPQTSFAQHIAAASFTNAYGLQTPLTPAFTGATAGGYPFPASYGTPYGSPTPLHFGSYFPGGGRRGRGNQLEDPSIVRSQRLEDFRQRKNNRIEFSDIYGNICEFAGDQHGSRFIQNKLETASSEERAKVFDEIMPNAYQLMTDVFGNYVIQKLFEHGDQQQKAALAKKMEGHVYQLSLQMYGCRVMQKALEHLLLEQREKLIAELDGHIVECVKSSNANHVIQRLISLDPPKEVTDAFIGHVQELSCHAFGCRVLQKAFEVLDPAKIRPLLDEMHEVVLKLMVDQFGNYVVQSVLTDAPGRESDRDRVVAQMKGRIYDASRHKFASNVVERAIRTANHEDRRELIAEMLGDSEDDGESRIGSLLRDAFGNFTVQTALNEADPDQRDQLLAIIVPLMPHLRHSPCGRRLEAKLQEYEAKGILPTTPVSATSSPRLTDGRNSADGFVAPNGKVSSNNSLRLSTSSPGTPAPQDENLALKQLLSS